MEITKKFFLLALFLNLTMNSALFGQSSVQIGGVSFSAEVLVNNLDIPWEVLYGSDGDLWISERRGRIIKLNPTTKEIQVLLDIRQQVIQQAESGMLGMAFDPDFDQNGYLYCVYTYRNSNNQMRERLVRYRYDGSVLVEPSVILDGIIANTTHNGARLQFLPDGTLLMSTGDAQDLTFPQDLQSLNGKVLRMNKDGSIPQDNPFENSLVYSFGHRNVQGMFVSPDGLVYITEHGASTDDEFQVLVAGKNYGWPNVEGFCNLPSEIEFCEANSVAEPLFAWTPTVAPSDLIMYQNPELPELDGKILMAVLKDLYLSVISEVDGRYQESKNLVGTYGRLRDICQDPSGNIYLATNGNSWVNNTPNTHRIIKLTPPVSTSSTDIPTEKNCFEVERSGSGLGFRFEKDGRYTVMVSDIIGRQIRSMDINGSIGYLDMDTVVSGVYLISVRSREGLFTQKIFYQP